MGAKQETEENFHVHKPHGTDRTVQCFYRDHRTQRQLVNGAEQARSKPSCLHTPRIYTKPPRTGKGLCGFHSPITSVSSGTGLWSRTRAHDFPSIHGKYIPICPTRWRPIPHPRTTHPGPELPPPDTSNSSPSMGPASSHTSVGVSPCLVDAAAASEGLVKQSS